MDRKEHNRAIDTLFKLYREGVKRQKDIELSTLKNLNTFALSIFKMNTLYYSLEYNCLVILRENNWGYIVDNDAEILVYPIFYAKGEIKYVTHRHYSYIESRQLPNIKKQLTCNPYKLIECSELENKNDLLFLS